MADLFKYGFLIIASILLVSSASSRVNCEGSISISQDGDTTNYLNVSITPNVGYYYPRGSEFRLTLPKNSIIQQVDSNSINPNINSEITSNFYRLLEFSTKREIQNAQVYQVNFKYTVENGAIIYGDESLFHQLMPTSSCSGSNDIKLKYPDGWELRRSEYRNYTIEQNEVVFNSYNRSVPLKIWFELNKNSSELITYNSGVLNVNFPDIYQDKIKRQTDRAQEFLKNIEAETGIKTPEKFDVEYLPLRSDNIGEEVAGQYYGGKIELSAGQLARVDERALETFLHEIVHGYSDRLSNNSPDWWWEEGTADYVTHSIMDAEGYEAESFSPSTKRINATFNHCEYSRSFISDWSPVDEPGENPKLPCDGRDFADKNTREISLIKDKDRLGYSYSELIVSIIFNNTQADLATVYDMMKDNNVTFSDKRSLMNNQINYFGSKATGKNLTRLLNGKGVATNSWKKEYKSIKKAESRIDRLNSDYAYFENKDLEQELESKKKGFYKGYFNSLNLAEVHKKLNNRNRTLKNINTTYYNVKTNIRKLEKSEEANLYLENLKMLNNTLDLVKETKFEGAESRMLEINNSAENKSEKIDKYKEEVEKLEYEIGNSHFLIKPFLVNAGEDIERSRASFRNGNLNRAINILEESKFKFQLSNLLAVLFFVSLLMGFGFIFKRDDFLLVSRE